MNAEFECTEIKELIQIFKLLKKTLSFFRSLLSITAFDIRDIYIDSRSGSCYNACSFLIHLA